MTNEELERALEFLVKSQADFHARQTAFEERMTAFEVRQEQTTQQIAELGMQLRVYADTQSQFIQIVTSTMTKLAEAQARTEQVVAETNARLDRLAAMVERNITGGNGAS
jgi:chromosome segregation ATPase